MTKCSSKLGQGPTMVLGGADLSDAEDRDKFIRYRGQRHGSRESMSDMISVLH
jgi:hypothetical protein